MKTERLQLLATPQFKAFLIEDAKQEGVSVAELVRVRCERRATDEEKLLAELTLDLQKKITTAQTALRDGIDCANAVLAELRLKNKSRVHEPRIPLPAKARRVSA
jgi:hypothetical protein